MRRLAIFAVAIVAFLVVAGLVARWLSAENAERDAVVALLRAQARGDARAIVAALDGCAADPACVARARAEARDQRAPGELQIVAYDSATAHSLGPASGPTRVVWRTPGRLTTVQCVGVRRTGTVLSGPSVSLTALSGPIRRTAACPGD